MIDNRYTVKVVRGGLLNQLYQVVIFDKDFAEGMIRIVEKVEPVTYKMNELAYNFEPAPIMFGETEAQILMDSLWDCGTRPSEGQGSAGQLAAVKYHLEDMRKLVFQNK
jgi:hypothetical protein